MIWFERAEHLKEQPDDFVVGIEGRFDPELREVSVWVMVFGGGDVEVPYWSKVIGGALQEEDITPELVYNKFSGKTAQIIDDLPGNFSAFIEDFRRRLTRHQGHPVYFDYQSRTWFVSSSETPGSPTP